MENRIKIGDVWYVKEAKDDISIKKDFAYSQSITYECDNFMIEATVDVHNEKFTTPTLKYVDKKDSECSWVASNPAYLIGIAVRNPKWMSIINDEAPELISAVKEMIDEMNKLGWITEIT